MGKDTLSQGIALGAWEKTLSHKALHSAYGKRHSLTRHCTRHTGKDTLSQGIALGTREKTLSHKALHSAYGKIHSLTRHCTRHTGKYTLSQGIALGIREKTLSHKHCTRCMGIDTLSQGIALGTREKTLSHKALHSAHGKRHSLTSIALGAWEKTLSHKALHSAHGKRHYVTCHITQHMENLKITKGSLTCTILAMSCGSMERGNRRMLKRESETKAFCASNTFSDDDITYTANVVKDTCNRTMFALLRISPNKRYIEHVFSQLDRPKRYTLHPLSDLFILAPTRLLWEAF